MNKKKLYSIVTAAVIGVTGTVAAGVGLTNPETPAGHQGYVIDQPQSYSVKVDMSGRSMALAS